MNDTNTVDKVINAKFIFSSTLKSIIVRNHRANHPAVTTPIKAEEIKMVGSEADPLNMGSERLSA